MKYEIKAGKIIIFERKKVLGAGYTWSPIKMFDYIAEMQKTKYMLNETQLTALKLYKRVFR